MIQDCYLKKYWDHSVLHMKVYLGDWRGSSPLTKKFTSPPPSLVTPPKNANFVIFMQILAILSKCLWWTYKNMSLNILFWETWVILFPQIVINLHCDLLWWCFPVQILWWQNAVNFVKRDIIKYYSARVSTFSP